jgi:hypothetical protein
MPFTTDSVYNLTSLPEPLVTAATVQLGDDGMYPKPEASQRYFWSNTLQPPAVGDRVDVRMNGFGPGTVTGYFTEFGYLGVYVKVDRLPDWYVKQNKGKEKDANYGTPMVFGVEVDYPLTEPELRFHPGTPRHVRDRVRKERKEARRSK